MEEHRLSLATHSCAHCSFSQSPGQTSPVRNSFLAPESEQSGFLFLCHSAPKCSSRQGNGSCRRADKGLVSEPEKRFSTAGTGKKTALLALGYKKVYMLHFEGGNCLHYSPVAQCLQLCLDTSDSQGNCFDAFCCAPLAELCNRCTQPPALRTAAFPVPAGLQRCRDSCVETLQSSLGPAHVFPATFEPVAPPVWCHPLFS